MSKLWEQVQKAARRKDRKELEAENIRLKERIEQLRAENAMLCAANRELAGDEWIRTDLEAAQTALEEFHREGGMPLADLKRELGDQVNNKTA